MDGDRKSPKEEKALAYFAENSGRSGDLGYIVRLVGQMVQVSVATVEIVKNLPDYR